MKEYIWNGITFPSLKAAAEYCGISTGSMHGRFAKGYICDDDMKKEKR